MATVIIPWRGGDPYRERAFEWVKDCYAAHHPAYKLVTAELGDGEWCKALAVMPALREAPSDVVVIADADVWCEGIDSAVRAVTCGAAEWAVPHKIVYRLDEKATEALTTNGPGGPRVENLDAPLQASRGLSNHTERQPYEGVWGGGIVVAHRDTLLKIPLDPQFVGIDAGHEDEAWGYALRTLCGPGWRGTADLIHLWHPPRPRLSHRKGSAPSWTHYVRYAEANRDPEQMTALIEEAHVAYDAHQ